MIKSGPHVAHVDQGFRQEEHHQSFAAKKGVADSRRDSPTDKPSPFGSYYSETAGWDGPFRLVDSVFINRGKLVNDVPAVLVAH